MRAKLLCLDANNYNSNPFVPAIKKLKGINMNNIIEQMQLQPSLIEIIKIFNEAPSEFISTLNFLDKGVLSPGAGIAKLKNKGAIIVTELRMVTDSTGRLRKNIAHYKLVGWSL